MSEKKIEDVKSFFDNFDDYGAYYRGAWGEYRTRYVSYIESFQYKSIKVLDLGCGRMCSLPQLLSNKNVELYHCVDNSLESIQELKEHTTGFDNVKIDACDIFSFIEDCTLEYDVILMFGVLMYFERDSALNLSGKLRKLLKPGGLFVLHEPNLRAKKYLDEHSYPLSSAFLSKLCETGKWRVEHQRHYNIFLIRKIVTRLLLLFKISTGSRLYTLLRKMEFAVETLFSKVRFGVDSMIVLRKSSNG